MSAATVMTFIDGPGPEWRRTVLVTDDGTILLCYDATGEDEIEVLERADADGEGATYQEHRYFPITWLTREFPNSRENCELIKQAVCRRLAV